MSNENVTLNVRGNTYVLKKHLTIGEQIAVDVRKASMCNGHWGAMNRSLDAGERSAAFIVEVISELDIRITDGPNGWKGASEVSDNKELLEIWEEWTRKSGLFPSQSTGNKTEKGTPPEEGETDS